MRNQNVRRLLLVLVATAPLSGCRYLSAGEDIEIIDPIATTIEARERAAEAGQDVASALDGKAEDEAFEEPTVEASAITADLIQSTDPSARAQTVARSRTDPFATLPIPLAPTPVDLPRGTATSANNGANNGGGGGGGGSTRSSGTSTSSRSAAPSRSANSSRPTAPAGPTPPAVRVREKPLVEPSPIAKLPAIPQPVIAPTVSVSGVIQIGGTPYAIVRSATEPERYVKVGDRIANGSVRVKRIETLAYEPRVIFEENGVEVARPISRSESGGEAAPAEEAATEPVALLPTIPGRPTALPTPLAIAPTGAVGQAATFLPRLPPTPARNLLQPPPGYVPNSLLLSPSAGDFQTQLPGSLMALPSVV